MDLSQHWVEEAQVTRVQVQLRSQQRPVRLDACMHACSVTFINLWSSYQNALQPGMYGLNLERLCGF
jgi:hypothetical protein